MPLLCSFEYTEALHGMCLQAAVKSRMDSDFLSFLLLSFISEQTQSTYLPKWFSIPLLKGEDCTDTRQQFFVAFLPWVLHLYLYILVTRHSLTVNNSAFFKDRKCPLLFLIFECWYLPVFVLNIFVNIVRHVLFPLIWRRFFSSFLPAGNICWQIKEKAWEFHSWLMINHLITIYYKASKKHNQIPTKYLYINVHKFTRTPFECVESF